MWVVPAVPGRRRTRNPSQRGPSVAIAGPEHGASDGPTRVPVPVRRTESTMDSTHLTTLDTAKAFIAAFENRDRDAVAQLLAPTARFVIPLSIEGTPEPWYVFEGPESV